MKNISVVRSIIEKRVARMAPDVKCGVYIAVFRLERGRRIRVGALGEFDFPAGLYFYVGSAQRNLPARLARHERRRKPLRWHIDYLSTKSRMLGAVVIPAKREMECRLAACLERRLARVCDGFGASDCRCAGHLFYASDWP